MGLTYRKNLYYNIPLSSFYVTFIILLRKGNLSVEMVCLSVYATHKKSMLLIRENFNLIVSAICLTFPSIELSCPLLYLHQNLLHLGGLAELHQSEGQVHQH